MNPSPSVPTRRGPVVRVGCSLFVVVMFALGDALAAACAWTFIDVMVPHLGEDVKIALGIMIAALSFTHFWRMSRRSCSVREGELLAHGFWTTYRVANEEVLDVISYPSHAIGRWFSWAGTSVATKTHDGERRETVVASYARFNTRREEAILRALNRAE